MNNELYNKYKRVHLTPQLVEMFSELLMEDEVNLKVFLYIGQRMSKALDPNSDTKLGATVNDIVKDIKVLRPVLRKKDGKYENVLTNIERKRAERAVHSLLMTGLCYYEPVGKSHVIYCTNRGIQVMKHIFEKRKALVNK
jgi:hypothetical protein